MQEIKAEEQAAAASAKKRRDATPDLFLDSEDEGAVPTGVASHVCKSASILSSKIDGHNDVVKGFKQESEQTISDIPCPTILTSIPAASKQTVVASGPYAGLLSAGKRRRDESANPFAPPKKQHCQSEGLISS